MAVGTRHCFSFLLIGDLRGVCTTVVKMDILVEQEVRRRFGIWESLKVIGGLDGVPNRALNALRIHRGQGGIYRDKEVTSKVEGRDSGIAVGLLSTGESYADNIWETHAYYSFPETKRGGRHDQNEIASMMACGRLGIPLFFVSNFRAAQGLKRVQLGWVADIDPDNSRVLIVFQEREPFVSEWAVAVERLLEERAARLEFEADKSVSPTDRLQITKARIGQGEYRIALLQVEPSCRVTRVANPDYLRASHIWPWRFATNQERLDPNNGLMLAPHVDFLFDRGFVSFADDGDLLVSTRADHEVLKALGVSEGLNVGKFSDGQRKYLRRHRDGFEQHASIFLR